MQKSEVRLHAFGQACHLVVDNSNGRGAQLIQLCREKIDHLERKFSASQLDSIVTHINRAAGTGVYTPLDGEARSLFQFVEALWSKSKHVYDPTTRILRDCYDASGALRASPEQLKGMLKLVGWQNLDISTQGAHLSHQGMLIDLNACIRPYVVDSVRKLLLSEGANNALIEMEQDVATIGKQPDGANWLIGVKLPEGNRAAIQRLKLNDKGFAIRGDFESAVTTNGERFGRALSPVDGQPIPGLLAVAVTADTCLTACSAASIARMMAEPIALKWLENLGLPWLAVDRTLTCHGTLASGLRA